MIWAVVIGTVSEGYGKAIGVVVGHHQVVAPGLACRIGGTGIVGCVLGKVARVAKAPIDFIGGDMMKEDRSFLRETAVVARTVSAGPGCSGYVEQGKGTHDVGTDKGLRPQNRPVHMTLGRKVDNSINLVVLKKALDKGAVADITLNKDIAGVGTGAKAGLDVGEAFGVARIGEEVQVDDPACKARGAREEVANHVGADESGAASNEKVFKGAHGLVLYGSIVILQEI